MKFPKIFKTEDAEKKFIKTTSTDMLDLSSCQLISKEPNPIYIDDSGNMYMVFDDGTVEEELATKTTTDLLEIRDATGTLCHGNWIENPFKESSNSITTTSLMPSLQDEIKKLWDKINNTHISLVHNCANCGAQLEIEENKPVFHCKYCGSTYIIGPAQVYSHY